MLTSFSIPKPFKGHVGVIQRNAIQNRTLLHPDCGIILCGDEPGTEEAACKFKIQYIPQIERSIADNFSCMEVSLTKNSNLLSDS